ncbi:hypothetical protein NAT51_19245 [Flavobacterium amniphilum]|uniref:hypothetical protein n=1 Tax=Flavobacterium amniphilum TaxID=1834035 RepID=UPI00202A5D9C|nr:hypothetical protein [Flavobacterium amniphilum]MCL9807667.1 hypothetical protein [Flavobacterium amniphilum]
MNKNVIVVIRAFVFLSLVFFQSCSSTLEATLLKQVNQIQGRKFANSRSEKSVFIKECRKKLFSHFLKEPMSDKKYYIVESYSLEHSLRIMVSAIMVDGKVSYYVYNSKTDMVENLYVMNKYEKAFYDEVFELAQKKNYTKLEQLHLEESRRLSHSSACYLIELNFIKDVFEVENNIYFESFGSQPK